MSEPLAVPTVPELDDILRRCLPPDVVFAIAPRGDPFTRWARFMLEGSATLDAARAEVDHRKAQAEGLAVQLVARDAEIKRLRGALADLADTATYEQVRAKARAALELQG